MKAPTFPGVRGVGSFFRDREGVPASAIIENLVPPVEIFYEREPTNPHDPSAIKIIYNFQHICYVERGQAAFIAPWMDEGVEFKCVCTHKTTERNNLVPILTFSPVEEQEEHEEASREVEHS